MKSNLYKQACKLGKSAARAGLTALLIAQLATNQAGAQNLFGHDTTGASTAQPEIQAPAPNLVQPNLPSATPNFDEAMLAKETSDAFFSLEAQDSSSQSGMTSSTTAPAPTAAKTKPPHHGLGVALAIVGTTTLLIGATGFALSDHFCKNFNAGICQTFHTGGIAMMPVGGAVAATGFYLEFHR
jgi:hypothetical protein